MTGVEAEVLFSMDTIWSKLASAGAFSWFIGILRASSLGTFSYNYNIFCKLYMEWIYLYLDL